MRKKAHELFGGKGDAAFGDTVFLAVLSNVLGTKTGFKSTDGGTGDYSSVWTVERDWDNRTSLITDPPDGRIPPLHRMHKREDRLHSKLRGVRPQGPRTDRCRNAASLTARRS